MLQQDSCSESDTEKFWILFGQSAVQLHVGYRPGHLGPRNLGQHFPCLCSCSELRVLALLLVNSDFQVIEKTNDCPAHLKGVAKM